MAFAQNVQCFVIDRYYRHINEKFPSKCEDALLTAFHLYMFQSMGKVIKAIFGAEGEGINNKVQQDFIERYGNDDFDKIKIFFGSDFEIPYPYGLKKD